MSFFFRSGLYETVAKFALAATQHLPQTANFDADGWPSEVIDGYGRGTDKLLVSRTVKTRRYPAYFMRPKEGASDRQDDTWCCIPDRPEHT